MFNQNQKEKVESNSGTLSKAPISLCTPENIEKLKSINLLNPSQKKVSIDPVQVALTATIFIFLAGAIYFVMGPISMFAMSIGGVLSVYHMTSSKSKMFSKNKEGRPGLSILMWVLIGSPFLMGGLVAYEGTTLLESPARIILLWAMTISFWTTMLFVPMSVLSKHRENLQPDLTKYPKVSLIIPAYNEEKVIKKTLESM